MSERFFKEERLSGKTSFEDVFENGKSFFMHPFKVLYLSRSDTRSFPVKLGIAVPKKRIRGAVQRNHLKRLIRESYRKQKESQLYVFFRKENIQIDLLLIYMGKEDAPYSNIYASITKVLQELQNKILLNK